MTQEAVKSKSDSQEGSILSLKNITKIFPGTIALNNISLDVRKGEVHGIIGKNGAGKSTLVGIIAGLLKPSSGVININGNEYAEFTRIVARNEKVSIVPQDPQLVQEATVTENLFMPDYNQDDKNWTIQWSKLQQEAKKVLEQGSLNIDVNAKAKDLGIGIQQLLLILKAAYVEDADIIILDEAASSLSETEQRLLFQIIEERKNAGVTILFISHTLDELLLVCDRMTVLKDGSTIATVNRDEVDKESLSSLIVGGTMEKDKKNDTYSTPQKNEEEKSTTAKPIILETEKLTKLDAFYDIDLSVAKNEILGIAGLMGSGRTEILKAIAGIDPPDEGNIKYHGRKVSFSSPGQAIKNGIIYLPEERDAEGLIGSFSVKNNLLTTIFDKLSQKLFFVDRSKEKEWVNYLANRFEIICSSMEQQVSELSGGNRQKVVFGKVVAAEPEIFLLDEPTKGIDIATKKVLLDHIKGDLSDEATIIMTAPGLEELIEVCDRILVLYKGEITKEFLRADFDEDLIYQAIQGN